MKTLKCPECGEISTFSHYYSEITTSTFCQPIVINSDGNPDLGESDEGSPDDNDPKIEEQEEMCICNGCGEEVEIDNVEVVEITPNLTTEQGDVLTTEAGDKLTV